MSKWLEAGREAAYSGAAVLKKYWGNVGSIQQKTSSSDLVTIADKQSEEAIIKVLKSHFPLHSILAEESGLQELKDSEYLWVIDPLDGTTNYTHNYPMVSISIALKSKEQILAGIVYNPILEEFFYAEKGHGAFLNDKPIKVSSTKELNASLLATGFAYDKKKSPETNYKEFTYFTQLTHGVRRGGSAALDLAYVATGRLDGYWERGLQAWDVAAGSLLVEEAGGRVSSYDNSPLDIYTGKVLASNTLIHDSISVELMKLSRTAV
jgi:myo-inositol-1(or 4)-monophosphatase